MSLHPKPLTASVTREAVPSTDLRATTFVRPEVGGGATTTTSSSSSSTTSCVAGTESCAGRARRQQHPSAQALQQPAAPTSSGHPPRRLNLPPGPPPRPPHPAVRQGRRRGQVSSTLPAPAPATLSPPAPAPLPPYHSDRNAKALKQVARSLRRSREAISERRRLFFASFCSTVPSHQTQCPSEFESVSSGAGIALPSPHTLACILNRAARSCAGCGEEADRGTLKSCSLCRIVWYCGKGCQASHRQACTRTWRIEPSAEAALGM
jgi:hypothetical protein